MEKDSHCFADRFCVARLQTDGTIKCGAPNRLWTRDDDLISVELKEILASSGYCARCSSYSSEAQAQHLTWAGIKSNKRG